MAAPGGRQTPITYPCSLKTWSHACRAACPFVLEKKKANFCRCARRRQFRLRSSALRSTVSTGRYSPYMQLLNPIGPNCHIILHLCPLSPSYSLPLQVLGPRPLKTQSVATFGQCLPHGRLEGRNHPYKPWHVSSMSCGQNQIKTDNRQQINPHISRF